MSALEEENEIIFITKMKINNLTFICCLQNISISFRNDAIMFQS